MLERSINEQLEFIRKSKHDYYLKFVQLNGETKQNETEITDSNNDYNKEKKWPDGTICILGDSMRSGVREIYYQNKKL